ncbi:MAG: MFS transporter [Hyphomicrobiales bacterium]|nr:MAG: MFS transporter [Hyphomicrobiales bacterium]
MNADGGAISFASGVVPASVRREGFMDSRLVWLALAAFVGSTEGGLINGLLPGIGADMGVSTGQTGQVVLGYSLGYAIGTPVVSVLLGGVGRRRILAGGMLMLSLCAVLMAVAPYFHWAVGARTLLALGAGTYTATALSVAAQLAPPGQRGRALQVVTMGQSLATLVGVPLGAFIATQFSWRIDYWAIAAMALVASVALYRRLPTGMHGDTQSMADRIRVLGNPGVGAALLTMVLFFLATYPPLIFVGALLTELEIDLKLLPIVLLLNGLGAMGASVTAGRFADRLGARRAVTLSALMLIGSLGLMVALPHLPETWRLPATLVAFALQGYIGWAFWIAHCSEMARLAPSSVPVAMSLELTGLSIGMAIAAGFGGLLLDAWGINRLCMLAIPVAGAAVAVWLLLPPRMAGPETAASPLK